MGAKHLVNDGKILKVEGEVTRPAPRNAVSAKPREGLVTSPSTGFCRMILSDMILPLPTKVGIDNHF
jgi:hypothetical protein